jgi:D-alanyl-D-alanine dipeptidase
MKIRVLLLGGLLVACSTPARAPSQADCAQSPVAGSDQLVVSIPADWNSKNTHIYRYLRDESGQWMALDRTGIPGVVGRNGLAWGIGLSQPPPGKDTKHEGDGRSPAGVFALTEAFGYHTATEIGWGPENLPYHQVTDQSVCPDDSRSLYYNHVLIDQRRVAKDWTSGENLRHPDDYEDEYEFAVMIDHNFLNGVGRDRSSKSGSCIFFHVMKDEQTGTAGCTAVQKDLAKKISKWLRRAAHPVLVQMPEAEYRARQQAWCLPKVD